MLRLQAVGKRFPNGTEALVGVDLAVAPGEFVSLLGPSGCGKSTLLRLVAGLDAPSTGTGSTPGASRPTGVWGQRSAVRDGAPTGLATGFTPGASRPMAVWGQRSAVRDGAPTGLATGFTPGASRPISQVGFVFQDPTLMPWASALDNAALPLRLAGLGADAARSRARTALARVGLAGFEGAWPRELSGGMRMRVSLARALVTGPRLLLLDEPFAALDEITRLRLNEDLRALWAEGGLTVLFVTHSVFESAWLSNRVVVLRPRPGRVHADMSITLPEPRTPALRTAPEYAAACRELSLRLSEAMAA